MEISKDEALEAVRKGAFVIDDPESDQHGRSIVHCFLGPIGADWDTDAVLDLIAQADEVAWVDNFLGHNLAVGCRGKVYRFDVRS